MKVDISAAKGSLFDLSRSGVGPLSSLRHYVDTTAAAPPAPPPTDTNWFYKFSLCTNGHDCVRPQTGINWVSSIELNQ